MAKAALNALAVRCEAAPPEQQRALLEEAWRVLFPPPKMDDLPTASSPYWAWCLANDLFGSRLDYRAYESAAGVVLKWVGGLAGAAAAIYTGWHMLTHGGKPPGGD